MHKLVCGALGVTLILSTVACGVSENSRAFPAPSTYASVPIRIVAHTDAPTPTATVTATPICTPTCAPTFAPMPTPTATVVATICATERAATFTPAPIVTAVPDSEKAAAFALAVLEKLGKPYRKGGEGEEKGGYDPSGLVYACLREMGLSVSRKSSAGYAQIDSWILISSMDELEIGDLLFFTNETDGEINVVAVCVGEGKMIYASSSVGEVIQCAYETNYWRALFAFARRVF